MQRWNPYETVLGVNNVGGLQLLWSYATRSQTESSPAVVNGVVYVGSDDSNVYALNASTGGLPWSFATNNLAQYSPAVANGVVYVGELFMYALNTENGTLLWTFGPGGGDISPLLW
jgi:eukaryotic-like serine/threonine-protein kinase